MLNQTTRSEVNNYLRQMQPLTDLWAYVTRQATSELMGMPLHRMMGAHIEHLQALYRGALALPAPVPCRRAHRAFLAAIGATIDAYLATAELRSDEQAHAILIDAIHAHHTWRSEIAQLTPVDQY